MVNTEFREMLINMYKTASKDIFSSENLNASITRAVKKIEPELEEHFERWSESLNLVGRIMSLYKSWEIPNMTLDIWHKELDDMREFAEKRPAYFEKYLMEYVAQFED